MSLRSFVTSSVSLILIGLTVAPACGNTAGVSEVYMSLDNDGGRRRTVFFTDTQEIHCIVTASFGRPDVTVHGTFHQVQEYDYAKPGFVPVDRFIGDADIHPQLNQDSKKPQQLDIKLLKVNEMGQADEKAPYPAGRFECIISIDGETVGKNAVFNINFPETCPQTFIVPNSRCKGFYPIGDDNKDGPHSCPKNGAATKEEDPDICDCKAAGWSCPNPK